MIATSPATKSRVGRLTVRRCTSITTTQQQYFHSSSLRCGDALAIQPLNCARLRMQSIWRRLSSTHQVHFSSAMPAVAEVSSDWLGWKVICSIRALYLQTLVLSISSARVVFVVLISYSRLPCNILSPTQSRQLNCRFPFKDLRKGKKCSHVYELRSRFHFFANGEAYLTRCNCQLALHNLSPAIGSSVRIFAAKCFTEGSLCSPTPELIGMVNIFAPIP